MLSLIVNKGRRIPNAPRLDAGTSLRRRWFYFLQAIFVTYSLAYIDRANFGFGVAAGLGTALHIDRKGSSLLAGLFFLGYFAFQIPVAPDDRSPRRRCVDDQDWPPFCAPSVAAIILMPFVGYIADKTQRRQPIISPLLLLSGAALLGSFLFAHRSFALTFTCLVVAGGCMYAPDGPFFAIVPERVPRNVTAEVMAMINSCGALGGFFGSYLVGLLRGVTGNVQAGYLLIAISLIVSAGLILILREKPLVNPSIFTETWKQA